jgi:hypothetical protein
MLVPTRMTETEKISDVLVLKSATTPLIAQEDSPLYGTTITH